MAPRSPRKNPPAPSLTPKDDNRESRGPETSHFLEDDTFSVPKHPHPPRKDEDFDEDLIR